MSELEKPLSEAITPPPLPAVTPAERSGVRLPQPPPVPAEKRLDAHKWGMIVFLVSEVAFFSTLIVTYLVFLGRDSQPGGMGGPTPEVLSLSLVIMTTLCLLSSSVTVHLADHSLRHSGGTNFIPLWSATIALGVIFLLGTAHEWIELIERHHLTISRNLFGTTFYTLIGFHAFHVTVGVLVMLIVLGLYWRRHITTRNALGVELVSWYWHFVDVVWVVVFTVVYLVGR